MKYLKIFENYKEETELSLKDVLIELGYIKPKKIADGGSSTIWKCSNTDNIIKLTNGFISANTMEYIRKNINHPNFIKIKKVYKVLCSDDKDIVINDIKYNHNPYHLNKYPLYVIETEDLDRLTKTDMKNIDYDYYSNLCDELGINHSDLHKDNIMKRKSDNNIVLIDILDDSLPIQKIKTKII